MVQTSSEPGPAGGCLLMRVVLLSVKSGQSAVAACGVLLSGRFSELVPWKTLCLFPPGIRVYWAQSMSVGEMAEWPNAHHC